MLSLKILSRGAVPCNGSILQTLHKPIKLGFKQSSSSSSDSDSDAEKQNLKQQTGRKNAENNEKQPTASNARLNALLEKIMKGSKTSKTIDVAKSSKTTVPKMKDLINEKTVDKKPFEKKFVKAAQSVAAILEGDPKQTLDDLVHKMIRKESKEIPVKIKKTSVKKDIAENQAEKQNAVPDGTNVPNDLMNLLNEMKANKKPAEPVTKDPSGELSRQKRAKMYTQPFDRQPPQAESNYEMEKTEETSVKKKNVAENEIEEQNAVPDGTNFPKNLMNLLNEMKVGQDPAESEKKNPSGELPRQYQQQTYTRPNDWQPSQAESNYQRTPVEKFDFYKGKRLNVFTMMPKPADNLPKLTVWDALEQRDFNLLMTQPPENVFQEMIQWTDKGILWHFPIDNEQGMESEKNVHFSEHVFMERHLQGWCPKKGPIRHFMELVCVGLSKNAFLTVEEKMEHVMWYKEYFKGKKSLLEKIGALPDGHSFEAGLHDAEKQT